MAIFLICLSVAYGGNSIHKFPAPEFQIEMVDFSYLDFPALLPRATFKYFSQKNALLPNFPLKGDPFKVIIATKRIPKRFCKVASLKQLKRIISFVICKNAP
jgi:hypothetical protein